MREVAYVRRSHDTTKRVMLHDDGQACYVFYFDSQENGPAFADTWHKNVTDAKQVCAEEFGIEESEWQTIPDPKIGFRQDIIGSI